MSDMRNYVKNPMARVSLLSVALSTIYQFGPTFSGAFTRMPLSINDALLPGSPHLPRHKHGCCKRGGRSKRRRGLNYWRR